MKKIYFFTCLIFLSLVGTSCSNEYEPTSPNTGYVFSSSAEDYANNGGLLIPTIFEYNTQGEKIKQNTIQNCVKDQKYTFKAHKDAVKAKVWVQYFIYGELQYQMWVQNVFYLEKGKTISIALNHWTIIDKNEP